MLKGKINEQYPMFTDKEICMILKAWLWREVKVLLITDAKKKDMSLLEYVKYLKAYHETHKAHR